MSNVNQINRNPVKNLPIVDRLAQLLAERNIPYTIFDGETVGWEIEYLPEGINGPAEVIYRGTKVADLHWL